MADWEFLLGCDSEDVADAYENHIDSAVEMWEKMRISHERHKEMQKKYEKEEKYKERTESNNDTDDGELPFT